MISGLISLSTREFPEVKGFAADLRQRISALGRSHDFIRPRSHVGDNTLFGLLGELLTPYQNGERILMLGQDVRIDDRAATPLALLFHELATNATKYRSLSSSKGRVTISTKAHGSDFEMKWCELDGP